MLESKTCFVCICFQLLDNGGNDEGFGPSTNWPTLHGILTIITKYTCTVFVITISIILLPISQTFKGRARTVWHFYVPCPGMFGTSMCRALTVWHFHVPSLNFMALPCAEPEHVYCLRWSGESFYVLVSGVLAFLS